MGRYVSLLHHSLSSVSPSTSLSTSVISAPLMEMQGFWNSLLPTSKRQNLSPAKPNKLSSSSEMRSYPSNTIHQPTTCIHMCTAKNKTTHLTRIRKHSVFTSLYRHTKGWRQTWTESKDYHEKRVLCPCRLGRRLVLLDYCRLSPVVCSVQTNVSKYLQQQHTSAFFLFLLLIYSATAVAAPSPVSAPNTQTRSTHQLNGRVSDSVSSCTTPTPTTTNMECEQLWE